MAIAEGRPEPPQYNIKDVRPVEMNDFKCALPMVREYCVNYFMNCHKD